MLDLASAPLALGSSWANIPYQVSTQRSCRVTYATLKQTGPLSEPLVWHNPHVALGH